MTTPRTILVVDDNDVNRQLTVDVLRWKGFTVLEATNGQDALDRIKSDHPDLVILDANPLENPDHYKRVVDVYKDGVRVDRSALPTRHIMTAP